MTPARKLAIASMMLLPGGVVAFVLFRLAAGFWPWGEAWPDDRACAICGATDRPIVPPAPLRCMACVKAGERAR